MMYQNFIYASKTKLFAKCTFVCLDIFIFFMLINTTFPPTGARGPRQDHLGRGQDAEAQRGNAQLREQQCDGQPIYHLRYRLPQGHNDRGR